MPKVGEKGVVVVERASSNLIRLLASRTRPRNDDENQSHVGAIFGECGAVVLITSTSSCILF